MIADNSTEKIFRGFLMKCLQILHMKINISFEDLDEIRNITSQSEPLAYCLKNIGKYPTATQPFILPEWQQVLWTFLFGLLILVAIVGNLMVIGTVLAHKSMRTVTNMFLVNLSVSDLIVAVFNTTFSFAFMLNSHWPFGRQYCTFNYFIGTQSVATSVFTITAISVDRYMGIVRPLSPRISKKTGLAVIILIWTLGCVISIPNLLFSDIRTYKYPDGTKRTLCLLMWPDGQRTGESRMDYIYNVIIMLTTYVLPFSIIAFTYSWMIHTLWKSRAIGVLTQPQRMVIKSKQRVARMLTVVALDFAVCWLPYHVYFLYAYYNPKAIDSPESYAQQVYLAIYWLAMSNSSFNPLVYYWMNQKFRNYFRSAFCFFRLRFANTGRTMGFMSTLRNTILLPGWSRKTNFTTVSGSQANEEAAVRGVPMVVIAPSGSKDENPVEAKLL